MTLIKTKYINNEPIKNMGIYFSPLLMFPFSTIETINEEKNEIIDIAVIENNLKFPGSTTTSVKVNGRDSTLEVVTDSLATKLRIIIKRWKERAKSKGAMKITITDIKIV